MGDNKKGAVIYFEGVDACGKGTQIQLVYEYLIDLGYEVEYMKQPGGTDGGLLIRELVLESNIEFSEYSKALLFAADRTETNYKISEHLSKGKIVLCDRSILSTYVYQGDAVKFSDLEQFNQPAMNMLRDFHQSTILYDIDGTTAFYRLLNRARGDKNNLDNIEARLNPDKLDKLNSNYKHYLRYVPCGTVISANQTRIDVFKETKKAIDNTIAQININK